MSDKDAPQKAWSCRAEPADGGWRASCVELAITVWAHTKEGAMRKLFLAIERKSSN